MQRSYERHLPHQVPEGFPIFLTWNLKGAVPQEVTVRLKEEWKRLGGEAARVGETPQQRKIRESKLIFAMADRYLDKTAAGPMHLRDADAAKIVEDSILFGTTERYELFAWCVLGNHVHVLLTPHWDLADITQGIKGYTAHQINGLRNARGSAFWQDESYDHWARDEVEMLRIIDYIENNPVAAGLCKHPQEWRWSSARRRKNWPPGQPYRK